MYFDHALWCVLYLTAWGFFSFQAPQSLHCGVCLQVVRRDALLALPCQHSFCKACWEQHCTVLVKDGMGVGEWGVCVHSAELLLFGAFLCCSTSDESEQSKGNRRSEFSVGGGQWGCFSAVKHLIIYVFQISYRCKICRETHFKCMFVRESALEG